MARQVINIGTNPNDGTGDALRDAFIKVNSMTNELYQALGDADGDLGFTLDSDGNIDMTNSLTVGGKLGVGSNTVPSEHLLVANSSNNVKFKGTSSTSSSDVYAVNDGDHGIRILTYGSGYTGGSIANIGANGTAIIGSTSSSEFVLGQYENKDFSLITNNSKRLTILAGGNLGIGSTSPDQLLDIESDSTPSIRITNTKDWASPQTGTVGQLEFYTTDTSGAGARVLGFIKLENDASSASPEGELSFGTALGGGSSAAATEKLRITANGAIEIKGQGTNNTFIGDNNAGNLGTSTGTANTAVGRSALDDLTDGNNNVALGYAALTSQTGGDNNVAIGYASLSLYTGNNSTAIGKGALENSTSGVNTAVGIHAGRTSTAGFDNTFIGNYAGHDNTTGDYNVFVGASAGFNNETANSNVALGAYALYNITTGAESIGIGTNAGRYRNDGTADLNPSDSIYIGVDARSGSSDSTPANEIVIGDGGRGNGDNTITLGNSSITALYCQVTSITSLSDARDKKDVKDISEGLDFVSKLKPVTFEWDTRDGSKKDVKASGFIAQDLLKAQQSSKIGDYLDLVDTKDEQQLQARYGNLIPVLVKALQEANERIEILESKLK